MSVRTALSWIMVGIVFSVAIPAAAGEEDAAPKMVVQEWRVLGPLLAPLPVFGDEVADDGALKALLGVRPVPPDPYRLIVDGNPLQDLSLIGTNDKWFDAPTPPESPASIRIIMKDGEIYKNTL